MIDLKSLNENQRSAVEWGDGPLLVLAGPGSGKTRVLTYRIARLLEESKNDRFRILGITFTNKAAAEMRQRLDLLVSEGRERAMLTTFHSFAAELLRQHGSHIGLQPDFAIQSQPADREAVLSDAIKEVGDSTQQESFSAERVLKIVDALLDEGIGPDEAAPHLQGIDESEFLLAAYSKYCELLVKANQQDFGTLLVNATALLRNHAGIAKQVRRIYKHFCVDEFQDTNAAQYELLLQLLPDEKPNVFIVADDDQVIYQWNGANPKRLEEMRKRFGMKTIQLPQNYRCPKEVIDLANRLISHNIDRAADKQQLTTDRKSGNGQVVRLLPPFANLATEVTWVRKDILSRPASERPKCVVLARTRKLLEACVEDFGLHGLPAHVSIKKTEFQSAPLRWLHACLRLANARTDREQVRRVCKSFYELEGINTRVEDVLAAAALSEGDCLRGWVAIVSKHEGLSEGGKRALKGVRMHLSEKGDYEAFGREAFEWFEALKEQPASTPERAFSEYEDEAACWKRLVEEIYSEFGRSEVTLSTLLQGMDLRSKEPPAPKNAVLCFTVHTAKGMEFDHVYLIGLAEDQMPSWAAVKKGPESLEMREERRNCFVAITRTQATLTLTYSSSYNGYAKRPSRFLREMGLLK